MARISHWIGLIAGVSAWLGTGCVFGAQAPSPAESAKIIVLLPENFRGWACADFGVAGSPPLVREGDAFIVRPRPGEVLKTSSKPGSFPRFYEAWYEVNGKRVPLPQDVYQRKEDYPSDSKLPVQRYCAFYGTEDEADAAPPPPGRVPFPHERQSVSNEERQALVALYEATDGKHWTHQVGWLGPPGTECSWHGVRCWSESDEPTRVTELDLFQNNLVGRIPREIGKLERLERLMIFGNRLSGLLPQELIQRWLSGALEISADASLLTDVTKIEFEFDPSALLCGRRRINLSADGRAALFTKRCRSATRFDRTTFCEVKRGRVWPGEFATLAWLLEKNGFYGMGAEYSRNVSDGAFLRTRAVRGGKRYEVEEYAGGGPFELWVIYTAIEGVASSIEWEKTTRQPECPKWDEASPSQPDE